MSFLIRFTKSVQFGRRLLVGVVALYLGISLSLGGSRLAKPVFYTTAAAWCLLLGWRGLLVSSEAAAKPKISASPLKGFWTKTELVFSNLILALLLGEIVLRTYGALEGISFLLNDTMKAHLLVPGRDYGNGLRGNSLGYPGPEFDRKRRPGIFRVASLGDSFALGPAVPFAENYLSILGAKLPGAEVYNFGLAGAGPREYLAILKQQVWNYQPDCVLVSIFVGNDLTEFMATPRHLDPRKLATYLLLSRCWRLGVEKLRSSANPANVEPQGSKTPPLSEDTFSKIEARRLTVCVKPSSPDMEKKWHRVLDDLEGIIAACGQHKIAVGFVLIPDEFQVNPSVLAKALKNADLKQDEVDLMLPQRRLTEFCREHGVPCLDLLPLLAQAPNSYAPRDTHWNVEGNRLAADQITRWLQATMARQAGSGLREVLAN